jgi:hypothetical protein
VVGDKSKPVEERRLALRFLIHCIQDLHRPCHSDDNRGRGENEWIKPGQKLGEDYMKANLPVARQRLYSAGIRLATVLNEALGAE